MKKHAAKKIVVKIGSSLFCTSKGAVDLRVFNAIAGQVHGLVRMGHKPVVVSSGAIAMGMHTLKLAERPKDLHLLQAAAAIGQNELMGLYRRYFSRKGAHVAQLLLTWEDFRERQRYLNAKNTLHTLLELGAVPVINENDTVSTDEIKFGDNDRLSALVATLVDADLLVILSDVEGLLQKDLKTVIPLVEHITPEIKALACPTRKKTCVGGMVTKIEACRIATESGIPCVIAHGRRKGILAAAASEPGMAGTLFLPKAGLAERDRWIAFGSKPKGKVVVDEGAKKAILARKSLLPIGVLSVHGDFRQGDVVSITGQDHAEFARGTVSLDMQALAKVKGLHHEREAFHRDNIVLISHA